MDLEVSEEEIIKFICRMLLTAIIELFGLSLLRRRKSKISYKNGEEAGERGEGEMDVH